MLQQQDQDGVESLSPLGLVQMNDPAVSLLSTLTPQTGRYVRLIGCKKQE